MVVEMGGEVVTGEVCVVAEPCITHTYLTHPAAAEAAAGWLATHDPPSCIGLIVLLSLGSCQGDLNRMGDKRTTQEVNIPLQNAPEACRVQRTLHHRGDERYVVHRLVY